MIVLTVVYMLLHPWVAYPMAAGQSSIDLAVVGGWANHDSHSEKPNPKQVVNCSDDVSHFISSDVGTEYGPEQIVSFPFGGVKGFVGAIRCESERPFTIYGRKAE
jgi:hypothetical protein